MEGTGVGANKERWVTIGRAFETAKGISLVFNALPLPSWDGGMMLFLDDRSERSERSPRYDGPDEAF